MIRRICVYGAGAVGGLLAAHLSAGGAEVSVVARGAQRDAIAARGITVRHKDGSAIHAHPRVLTDAPDLSDQDAVIVTVKTPAIPNVARTLAASLRPEAPVVFVNNGVPWWYADGDTGPFAQQLAGLLDPDRLLHDTVGADRAIGGVIYTASAVAEPGLIESKYAPVTLILGEPDGRISDRLLAIAALFEAGGLVCQTSERIRAAVWDKLLTNIAPGPLCLLSRQTMRRTFADPPVLAAATQMIGEGLDLAAAILGYPLQGSAEDHVRRLVGIDHKPSLLMDLELGRPLETETLCALPLRLARIAGAATPMLDLMTALALQSAASAGTPP